MTQPSKIQPLRIADPTRGIGHVLIRNLEVLAQIGFYGHEQGKLQPVRINVDLEVEDVIAVEDRLEKVVDYASIEQRIRAIIGAGHINLAETLAERIAETSFDDARVKSVRVRVEKLHALPGAESAG